MEFLGLELTEIFVILAVFFYANFGHAQSTSTTERKLEFKQIFTEFPTTSKRALSSAFSKEAILPWTAILGSTAILVEDDERWLAESKRFGRKMDWAENDRTETKTNLFGKDILRLPTDKGSAVYFLGDGWLHMSIAGGFLLTGYAKWTRPNPTM